MFNTPKVGPALPFRMPYIAGANYSPGPQPNAPGESVTPYGTFFGAIPWPNVVGTISALANFPGAARDYPVGISNNAVAFLPSEFLFIGGFAGKSKG